MSKSLADSMKSTNMSCNATLNPKRKAFDDAASKGTTAVSNSSNKENPQKPPSVDDAAAYWQKKIQSQLTASRTPVLAEHLFVALWENCGRDVAIQALGKGTPSKKRKSLSSNNSKASTKATKKTKSSHLPPLQPSSSQSKAATTVVSSATTKKLKSNRPPTEIAIQEALSTSTKTSSSKRTSLSTIHSLATTIATTKKTKSSYLPPPKSLRINGTWKLDRDNWLKIDIRPESKGLDDCTWIRRHDPGDVPLELASSWSAGKLVFKGEIYEHNHRQEVFEVEAAVVYQYEGDLACVELSVTQKSSKSGRSKFDSQQQFTGERV